MLHCAVSDLVLHCLPMSHKMDARLIWVYNQDIRSNKKISVCLVTGLKILGRVAHIFFLIFFFVENNDNKIIFFPENLKKSSFHQ